VNASRQNCDRSRFGKQVRIDHCDATVFKIPSNANVIFFFNPFGTGIMSKVIANLEQSLVDHPRQIEIVYFNPIFNEALVESKIFTLRDRWPEIKDERYAAEFWCNG
jgi:hypothetical protein